MTMPTLSQIIAAVQDVTGAVTGIRFAPDVPPEQSVINGVIAVCYPAAGMFREITSGREQGEHTLHLLIATPARNLRTDWARIIGLGDTVPRALLAGGTLTATVLQTNEITYTFGPVEWGDQQLFGWIFNLDVLTIGGLS